MKKNLLIILIFISIFVTLVGCNKKEENKIEKIEDNNTVKETNEEKTQEEDNYKWILNTNYNDAIRDDDIKEVFEEARKKYRGADLNPIALLGEQLVAGTNYMFLCSTEINNEIKFKVMIVYKDLDGNISLDKLNDFDITRYANKNKSLDTEVSSGGWKTNIPGKPIMLDQNIQIVFDKVTNNIKDATYYPIAVLAHQENNNYLILCYGRLSDQDKSTGVFALTINTDKEEILSISAINLNDYNQ